MSTEAEVSDALDKPVDNNAQAADEAKKMLAELSGEPATTNGKSEVKSEDKETINGTSEKNTEESGEKAEKEDRSHSPEYRRRDRSDRDRPDRGRGRGRGGQRGGRGGFQHARNTRNNIKSDVTTLEESDDPVAIRKQVEFYFSDSNLPRDKFLLGKVGGSQNNPVELKILHSFKRMRHFQPFEAIVNAMKESTFLEICENDTCVRRREPLPAELDSGPDPDAIQIFEDRAMPRSVYAKGFGEETPSTQFDIEGFFAEHGATNAVRLRRSEDKTFKGSVFVEFDTEETAQKFLEKTPKPQYKGKELQIMSKKDYCEKKVDDIKAGRMKPNKQYEKNNGGFGGGDRRRHNDRGSRDQGKRKRDDEDDRDWRVRRDEDRARGFKEDKRRGGKHDRDGKDGKGRKESKYDAVEKDDRGIPVVKSTEEKDALRADALAKAKALVEAENKKQEETQGVKREREDDEGDAEREVKKVDIKEGDIAV